MMTRAEWYTVNGPTRGARWRKCRVAFRCGYEDNHRIKCTNTIQKGEDYFDTAKTIRVGYRAATGKEFPITLRLCFTCATNTISKHASGEIDVKRDTLSAGD
jgi:hypothetical protein